MPLSSPPTMSAVPATPDRADRTTFSARAVALFDFIKNTLVSEITAAMANVFGNATVAYNSASAASASQVAAASAQAAAEAASNASAWVSGTTYAAGNVRYSLVNFQSYRRTTSGAGTTDPSLDAVNWVALTGGQSLAQIQATALCF